MFWSASTLIINRYILYGIFQQLFGIIASVLHLGNVHFDGDTKGYVILNSNAALRWVSKVSLFIIYILIMLNTSLQWHTHKWYLIYRSFVFISSC